MSQFRILTVYLKALGHFCVFFTLVATTRTISDQEWIVKMDYEEESACAELVAAAVLEKREKWNATNSILEREKDVLRLVHQRTVTKWYFYITINYFIIFI